MADCVGVIYCMQIDLHEDSILVGCGQACPLNYVFELSLRCFHDHLHVPRV